MVQDIAVSLSLSERIDYFQRIEKLFFKQQRFPKNLCHLKE
jgi:hypothetical protein